VPNASRRALRFRTRSHSLFDNSPPFAAIAIERHSCFGINRRAMQSTGEVECPRREDQNGFDPEASVLSSSNDTSMGRSVNLSLLIGLFRSAMPLGVRLIRGGYLGGEGVPLVLIVLSQLIGAYRSQ
jgi:hypothetical protein